MKRLFLTFCILVQSLVLFSQSVPFPPSQGRDYNAMEPYGYQQLGTTWDTSPFLPFIYHGMWFRLMPPNGVTYNASTKTWNFSQPGKKYPIILFFHGRGEVGTDNNKQLIHGGLIHRNAVQSNQFEGFLLYPQSIGYVGGKDILEKVLATLPVDINRIYVHGLSNGGAETWKFAINYPQLVAATFPMSASDDDAKTENLLYTPIRQAQGGLDTNPKAEWTQTIVDWFNTNGGHLEYFLLPTVGHGTWNTMYNRSDFFSWFLSKKKNQIYVRHKKNEPCPGDPINVVMGFTPGFEAYEWRKDGVAFTGTGAGTYKITATEYGLYTGRFRYRGVWTDWSDPVEVKAKQPTTTPPIQLTGLQTVVIPDVDGNSNVNLTLPDGYETYTWYKEGITESIGVGQVFTANTPGGYTATVKEVNGCSSIASPIFNIINANGPLQPEAASNLQVTTLSRTELRLNWENNLTPAVDETGFEIFRADEALGPYKLIAVTAANVLVYNDRNLQSDKRFWYKVRAITGNGAAPATPPVDGLTDNDVNPPTPPNNLTATAVTATSVSLSWAASTDDVGVIGYDVYVKRADQVNYVKAYTVTGLSQTVFSLESNKLYNFIVRARDAANNSSQPSQQVNMNTGFSGVNYWYYHGTWTSIPDFTGLTPVRTGTLTNFSISPRTRNDNYAFRFTGTIYIPTTGPYTFFVTSKDGNKLWVNNTLVVNDDGVHNSRERSGNITLNQGFYPIEVHNFESTGTGERLEVRWQGPGISKQTIPNLNLREGYDGLQSPPAAPATPTVTVLDYKSLRVNWGTYSGTATQIEVFRSTNNSTWNIIATVPATDINYVDPKLNPSTRYYYRLRAINSASTSAFTSSANATTQALPNLPAAPSGLTTTAISASSVSLQWVDASNNEENFEVYKSAGNNTSYVRVATLGPGVTTYTDPNLFAHTLYFYKVLSKNVRGSSAFSNEIQFTSLNNAPVLSGLNVAGMRYDEELSIPITATDVDNDLIIIGSDNLPAFAQIYDYGEGAGELFLSPTIDNEGTHTIPVFARDIYGGRHEVIYTIVIGENHNPVVEAMAPVTLKESYVSIVSTTASDADNEPLTWSLENAPSFIIPTISGNSISLRIQPGVADAGTYNVGVRITDIQGGTDIKTLQVTVEDFNPNYKLNVDFNGTQTTIANWNVVINNTNLYSLTRDGGGASDVTLQWSAVFNGAGTNGTSSPNASFAMPTGVPSTYLWHSQTTARVLTLRNLNPNGKYHLRFFSSDLGAGSHSRVTTFTIAGLPAVQVNAFNNTTATAEFLNVAPNAQGEIQVSVGIAVAGGTAIINALQIESFFDGNTIPNAPTNLAASYDASANIRLTWNDVATETGYEVFESTDNVNFTMIQSLPLNTTTFTDVNFTTGVTYYYKVTAKNGYGPSAYSNTVTAIGQNRAPVIQPLTPLVMEEAAYRMIAVDAVDAENQELTFSLENEPSFLYLGYYDENTTYLMIAPPQGSSGTYQFLIHCDDPSGARATATYTLTVKTAGEFDVRVNFGSTYSSAGWNNISSAAANVSVTNLRDANNVVTDISINSATAWTGVGNGGVSTGNNSGPFPDAVMTSYLYIQDNTTRNIILTGLKNEKLYDLSFFTSRTATDATLRNTVFAAAGKTITSNATNNASTLAKLTRLKPTNGQITIAVSRESSSPFGYLNAMVIREYADLGIPLPPSAPATLASQVLSRSSIRLTWQDNSDDETGFEIWRSVGTNANYELLTTVAANATAFTNTALASSTTYHYKVRALNAAGQSAYSNETSASTFDFSISVNFNSFRGNEPGWNNLPTYLRTGQSVSNLTDELGVNTGVSMTIVEEFQGDNPYGMTTGNNSGVVPDRVMEGSWWIDPRATAILRFNNLSFLRKYNFSFFGSRAATGDRNTVYIINGVSVTLNASMNSSNIVQIKDVVPASDGTITVTITTTLSAQFGYLNGLIIQAVPNDGGGGARLRGNDIAAEELSVENMAQQDVTAYPNPFTDKIVLTVGDDFPGELKTTMRNVSGRIVHEQYFEKKGRVGEIELEIDRELPAGMYILNVQSVSGKMKNIKLLKK